MNSWGRANESAVEQSWSTANGPVTSISDLVGDPEMWSEWKVELTGPGGSVARRGTPLTIRSIRSAPAPASS